MCPHNKDSCTETEEEGRVKGRDSTGHDIMPIVFQVQWPQKKFTHTEYQFCTLYSSICSPLDRLTDAKGAMATATSGLTHLLHGFTTQNMLAIGPYLHWSRCTQSDVTMVTQQRYGEATQSCDRFPNHGQSLPTIQSGFVHNYLVTCVCILSNNSPQFG